MNPVIAITPDVTTLINVLTVEPENQARLFESLRHNTETVVCTLPGWISTSLIVSHDKNRIIIYSQWRDLGVLRAMQSHPQMRFLFARYAMESCSLQSLAM